MGTKVSACLLLCALVLLASALVLGNIALLSVVPLPCFVIFLGLLLQSPSVVSLHREISRETIWVGETVTIKWNITVGKGLGLIFFHDKLPQDFELSTGINYRIFWKGLGQRRFNHAYTVRCPRRGVYLIPPTQWESRHPLDLRQSTQNIDTSTLQLTILPKILGTRHIREARGLARTPYPMMDLARVGVTSTDFKEIRQYVPGDPIRFINWKATARNASDGFSQPLVNQFEMEGKKAIWVFLDSSNYMVSGTSLQSPLEHAIEAAGGLGYYYLTRGYYVGAHFSTRPSKILYPDTGKRQYNRLIEELLSIRPIGMTEYDIPNAVRTCRAQIARYSPRCIIITRLDSPVHGSRGPRSFAHSHQLFMEGIDSMLSLSNRAQRHLSIWVIAVNGYNYPQDSDPTVRMGTTLMALETAPVVAALRSKGVSILEWNPFQEDFGAALLRQIRRVGS